LIVLCGSASGPVTEAKLDRPNYGIMLSPSTWRRPWREHWAADNDAWANRNDLGWWEREGETAWFRMLDKIAPSIWPSSPDRGSISRPLFAVIPDVVFDWNRTLERAHHYLPELRAREIPAAVALQDGAEKDGYEAAASLDTPAVFLGGSTRQQFQSGGWKWQQLEPIRQRFWREWLHVGRVNGPCQIRECLRVGVDSVDGTGWARFSRKMMPALTAALDGRYQAEQLRMPLH
jgi:hypothetical protein